ncbi:zinc ribbon domain-containing protein [Streptomyces sp. NPDC057460]|uniref:zinc ribbon domain-containing protein n=1 Tax=Streptomyces sp. NPDC057460 TaxID=3346141 RepID=UPI0036B229AD
MVLDVLVDDAQRCATAGAREKKGGEPACGLTAKENRPTQEKFHCVGCGHLAHADTVGAINVLRAGLARREAKPA